MGIIKYIIYFDHSVSSYTQGPHSNGETPDPMLMNCNEFSAQADTNCPLHPATNDLPCPLPQGVTDTLKQVEKHLSTILNNTNVVSWFVSRMYLYYVIMIIIIIIIRQQQ